MDDGLSARRKVAEIAKIPPENRSAFCKDLLELVRNFRALGPYWRQPQRFGWLGPIPEQAATLRDSVESILRETKSADEATRENAEARIREVEALAQSGAQDLGSSIDIGTLLGALDALAEHGKAASSSNLPKKPEGAGRPPDPLLWQAGATASQLFPNALQTLVTHHGGTQLSASKDGTGTMFDALNALGFAYTFRGVVRSIRPDTKQPENS
jgi:hypothetical protein